MSSVVSYTLAKCQKCLKCLRVCPVEAISIKDERVRINKGRCINCGRCIDACVNQGLQAKGSTLDDLDNYDIRIALIPTSLYGDCDDQKQIEELFATIKKFGFERVVDLSAYDGAVYEETYEYASKHTDDYIISSFCPVINRLIEVKYPMLLNNLMPLDLSAELAAQDIRSQYANFDGSVGIFLLCECMSKLPLAKYPYGESNSAIDHALAVVDLFPLISRSFSDEREQVDCCPEGIRMVTSGIFSDERYRPFTIVADGLEKVQLALDLAEFGQLKGVHYLHLSNCINGCIGGNLLWGNPFEGNIHMRQHLENAKGPTAEVHRILSAEQPAATQQAISMQERLAEFARVNAQLEQLPGYDCGACGFASCRIMAEEIVAGRQTLNHCRIRGQSEDES